MRSLLEFGITRMGGIRVEQTRKNIWGRLAGFLHLVCLAYGKYLLFLVLQCALLAAQSVFSSSVLSILLLLLEKKQEYIFQIAFVLAGVSAVLSLAAKVISNRMAVQRVAMKEKILHLIFLKNTRIPYEQFEKTDFLALTEAARFAATNENCIELVLNNGAQAIQAALTLGSITVITIAFDWRLTALLAITSGLNLVIMKQFAKARTAYWREQMDVDRSYIYYSDELQKTSNGKDFRMYTVGCFLQQKFHFFVKKLLDSIRGFDLKEAAAQSILQIVSSVETVLVYAIVLEHARRSALSAASITFFVSVTLQFSAAISLLISTSMRLLTGLERAEPLVRLMQEPEEMPEGMELSKSTGLLKDAKLPKKQS